MCRWFVGNWDARAQPFFTLHFLIKLSKDHDYDPLGLICHVMNSKNLSRFSPSNSGQMELFNGNQATQAEQIHNRLFLNLSKL